MSGATIIRKSIGQLIESADKLRNLAGILEELGATQGSAEPAELRRAVVGIQAAAMQVIFTGAMAVGVSERLNTIARVREGASDAV
jgi:hypothetical protein